MTKEKEMLLRAEIILRAISTDYSSGPNQHLSMEAKMWLDDFKEQRGEIDNGR